MAIKASFTPEEWSRVLASPMVAGMAITAADPSGLWGIMKEGMAGGWALLHAKQDPKANALVKAVADDFASGDAARHSDLPGARPLGQGPERLAVEVG